MSQRDYCSKEGASFLSTQLRSYWALRGATVFFRATSAQKGDTADGRFFRHDIRSGMVNGTPLGFVWRGAKLVPAPVAPVRRVALRG